MCPLFFLYEVCKMAKDKVCGVYKITNKVNGKVYIGQSKDIYIRWKNHKVSAKYSGSPAHNIAICRAIREYGEDKLRL